MDVGMWNDLHPEAKSIYSELDLYIYIYIYILKQFFRVLTYPD